MTLFDQNLTFAKPIIEQITVDLVRFIQHFYQMEDLERRSLDKLQGEVNNYFVMIKSVLETVWKALATNLGCGDNSETATLITEHEAAEEDSSSVNQAISLIDFCLKSLQPQFALFDDERHDIQTIKEERIRMQQEKQIQSRTIESQSKQLVPIISKLLGMLPKLSKNMKKFENTREGLQLIRQILQILDQGSNLQQIDIREAIDQFEEFYVNMCEHLLQEGAGRKLVAQRLLNFQACSNILCDIQRYADPASFERMPNWLQKVIDFASERNVNAQRILLTSAEILLDLLEKETANDMSNIRRIQELILPGRGLNEMDVSPVPGGASTNHCQNIIKNLWSLLGESGDHTAIVSLLKRFDLLLP